jgi:hypothetical protein
MAAPTRGYAGLEASLRATGRTPAS